MAHAGSTSISVYLLKSKSTPQDEYEVRLNQLAAGTYNPHFIPALDFVFPEGALNTIQTMIERFSFAGDTESQSPPRRYSGLIFSSPRAADAFATAVVRVRPDAIGSYFHREMPIYAVGPATACRIRRLGLPCQVLGDRAGTCHALAAGILQWHRKVPQTVTYLDGRMLPLLWLRSESTKTLRETISQALQSDDVPAHLRVPVAELSVYGTRENEGLKEAFAAMAQQAKMTRVTEQWITVFSPHGCKGMLQALQWLDKTSGKFCQVHKASSAFSTNTKIATIGPTTRDFLVERFGIVPEVCAARPNPEGLVEAIELYRAQQSEQGFLLVPGTRQGVDPTASRAHDGAVVNADCPQEPTRSAFLLNSFSGGLRS